MGCDFGKSAGFHLTTDNLKQIGRDFCRSLIPYYNLDKSLTLINIKEDIKETYKTTIKFQSMKIIH